MHFKLISIVLINLLFIINVTNCQKDKTTKSTTTTTKKPTTTSSTTKRVPPQQQINHYLKWITNDTQFPLKLTVPINSADLVNDSFSWDWLRLKDESLITHLPTLFKDYLVTETEEDANLYIMNYNHTTNEQLGSYEPLLVYADEETKVLNVINDKYSVKDVFTLAYLKKHAIKVENTDEYNHVSCYADFLVAKPSPNTTSSHTFFVKSVMNQMERGSKFTMRYKQHGKSEPEDFQKKFTKITNNVPSFDDRNFDDFDTKGLHRLHEELLASLGIPPGGPFNFFDNSDLEKIANFFHPPLPNYPTGLPLTPQSTTLPTTTTTTKKVTPARVSSPTPATAPPSFAQALPNPQSFFQPKSIQPQYYYSQPQQPSISQQPIFKNQLPNIPNTDMNYFYPYMFSGYNTGNGYDSFGSMASAASNMGVQPVKKPTYKILPLNNLDTLDTITLRYKRDKEPNRNQNKVKTELKNEDKKDEDLDFDSANFFKIRLSLGPISIRDKIQSIESIECSLTLVSLGDSPYYLSKISEKIQNKEPGNSHDSLNDFKSFYAPNHETPLVNGQANENIGSVDEKAVEHKQASGDKNILFLIDSKTKEEESNNPKKNPMHSHMYSSAESSFQNKMLVVMICILNSLIFSYL